MARAFCNSKHLVSAILGWQGHREHRWRFLAIRTNSTQAENHIVLAQGHFHSVDQTHVELVCPLLLRRGAPEKLVAGEQRVFLHVPVEFGSLFDLGQRSFEVSSGLANVYVCKSC